MLKDTNFILAWMFFMHIVDDFYLQGILAKLKQKEWWKENYPDNMCKDDYKMALETHALSWSFMIMLPLAFYNYTSYWGSFLVVNWVIHYVIDDLKANKHKISFGLDQASHHLQIVFSWVIYVFCLNKM